MLLADREWADEEDPNCQLDYTPVGLTLHELNVAISNSFGFGGGNACLAAKKYKEK